MKKLVIIGHKDDCVQLRSGYDFRSTAHRYRIAAAKAFRNSLSPRVECLLHGHVTHWKAPGGERRTYVDCPCCGKQLLKGRS